MASTGGEYKSLAEVIGVEGERIARLSSVGWRLYDERRFREAASVFRGLTVLDPQNVDLYRGLALAASKDNDLLTAVDALEKAEALLDGKRGRERDRGYLLALLSALLYRSGRRREAVERSAQSLAISPPDAPWVEPLKRGSQKAETLLARAPQKSAAETETVRQILRARLTEVGRGQATLARALGYQDRDLMKVFDNGAALLDAGEPRRASRIFEGLIELDGGVPLFHLALAQAREVAGHHKDAAAAYDEAVRAARQVPGGSDLLADALLRRARHLFKRGRKRSCRRDVDEALALPGALESSAVLGQARKILRSLGETHAELEAAVARQQASAAAPPPSQEGRAQPSRTDPLARAGTQPDMRFKTGEKSGASGEKSGSGRSSPNTPGGRAKMKRRRST